MRHDFRDATIVPLSKNKGSREDCGNYRGRSLLSIAGKILERVILNRMIDSVAENTLPDSQCGFRPGHNTVDMVFAVRQIHEKCTEQQMGLFACFIDLTKEFNTVNRALWVILSKLCCPSKFINLIRLFHDGMSGSILCDDGALLAHSEADLQAVVNKLAEATHLFGLTISIKKTEVLHQPSPAQRFPSSFYQY